MSQTVSFVSALERIAELEEALALEEKANDMLVIERDDFAGMVEVLRAECSALDLNNTRLHEEVISLNAELSDD